ncbi:MAG TPA: hypothetical protein VMG12_08790 [Polyangiaceae bacterium]|nr:hypothetical protein [Polyangiaceae bacterium]
MRNGSIGFAGALLFAAALAAVGGVLGCGSDGGSDDGGSAGGAAVAASSCTMSSGGTSVTSLCGAAALNALTAAEAAQLCSDTSAYVVGAIARPTGCKYQAIVAAASNSSPTEAQLQAACASTEMTCTQDATVQGPGANTLCGQIPATCTASIEQYSTCVEDQAVLFEQEAAELTACSLLTFGNLSSVYDVPNAANAAPSCMTIKAACPNFTLPYIN